jgi:hypothetical protein
MKNKIWILIALCALLVPGSIIWCISILSNNSPSLFCISDWGNFGSLASGTIGLAIALLNLIAFIFLTIEVSNLQKEFNSQQLKIQNDINERQLEFQKKSIFAQLRSERISKISDDLFLLTDSIKNIMNESFDLANSKEPNEISKTQNIKVRLLSEFSLGMSKINSFIKSNEGLFIIDEKINSSLINILKDISNTIEKMLVFEPTIEYTMKFYSFINERDQFIKTITDLMLVDIKNTN